MIWERKLEHIMNRSVLTFSVSMKIEHAVQTLVKHRYSGAPVVDEKGAVIGMLAQKDCLRAIVNSQYHDTIAGFVSDYMRKSRRITSSGIGVV